MRFVKRAHRILAGSVLVAAVARVVPAFAQTGDFVNAQPYGQGLFGGPGVQIQNGQIWVDVNGNDLTDPGIDTFHPIPTGLATGWALHLTPSRRVMVAVTSTGEACPGTAPSIRLYAIPTQNGADLVQLGVEKSLSRCIQQIGFFDDPTKAIRTGFFREAPDAVLAQANILWFDLVTGAASNSPFPYDANFGFVHFAPDGNMAWVQHGLNAPLGTKYSIVTLCPVRIGQSSQQGLTNQSGTRKAVVEAAGGGGYNVVIRDDQDHIVATFAYDDCAITPPVTGACCLPGGGCLGGTTQSECVTNLGGTWKGAGSACPTADCPPPPAPHLTLTMTGPASAPRASSLTYAITASNTGTLPSATVTVTDRIPDGSTFVSASNGGTFDVYTGVVTWNLGTLAAGGVQPLSLVVKVACFGSSMVNDTYAITGTPGGTVNGSPAVTTTISSNSTPLTYVLTSQALSATPLKTGNHVRHTIQMTNTLAIPREDLTFSVMAGLVSDIVQVVDAGGGTTTLLPNQLTWTGTIGPSATIQVVYETAIKECRAAQPSTEQMNRGIAVFVRDICGQSLGFTFPTQTIAVAPRPFVLRMESTNRGPVQTWSPQREDGMMVARPGATVDMALRLVYSEATTAPACQMSVQFPAELTPVGDPPFIGTPPSGTTWDAATKTILWSGTPPPSDSAVIAFRGQLTSTDCRAVLDASGSYGSCTNGLRFHLQMLAVPQPPSAEHIEILRTYEGITTHVPGNPGQFAPLACGAFDNLRGFGRTPDGTLWVVGTPSFRLNPYVLSFQALSPALLQSLQMDYPYDAAGDPRDTTVVFTGYLSGYGIRVRRYNPRTGQVTVILNDTNPLTLGPGNSVDVDPQGMIGVQLYNAVLRINPAMPSAYQVFSAPSANGLSSICLDLDNKYLVTEGSNTPGTRRLFKLDPATGIYTEVIDLQTPFGSNAALSGIAALPNQDVYVGNGPGDLARVHRAPVAPVEAIAAPWTIDDLLFVGGDATTDAPGPRAGAAPSALFLSPAAPNPFRAGTTLRFGLPRRGPVDLAVFDVNGRHVRTLAEGERPAGEHAITWEGRDDEGRSLGAGLYFARLRFAGEARRIKLVIAD